MMNMNVKQKIALSIAIVAFAACAEEITEGKHYRFEDLVFQASLEDWNEIDYTDETRSAGSDTLSVQTIPAYDEEGEEYELTITTERDTSTIDENTVTRGVTRANLTTSVTNTEFIGYAYVNGDGVADQLLINGIKRTIASNGTWLPTGASAYEWPSPTQVINFYGIIPSSYTINTNDKTLSFTQSSATPSSHVDLLVASSEPLNRLKDASQVVNGVEVNNPIPMKFKHALTAVRFKANKDLPTMTISEVRLKGFSKSGIYTLPIGDASGSWSPGTVTQDYYTTSPTTTSVTSTTNTYLNDAAQTFLMIPQSMSTTKKLVLKVTESSKTRYITANFGGTAAWKPGTSVVYTLSRKAQSGYYLYSNFYKEDGSQYIQIGARNEGEVYTSITSFYLDKSSTRKTQYWKITGWSTDGSSWNTTLSGMKSSQNDVVTITGSTYGAGNTTLSRTATSSDYDFYVKKVARPYAYSGAWLDAGTTIAGNTHSGTIDLSKYDCLTNTTISQTTANCYLVNGVGSYKFPTVYGNAIQNGSTVTATYSGYGFKDYAGNTISAAAISVPSGATAKILWIDTEIKDVISSVSYSSNYITFTVAAKSYLNASRVVPGNAVIGLVTSDNKVIWQWLINFTTDSQNNRDLGRNRCGYYSIYNGSYFYLRIQQVTSSNGSTVHADSPTCVIRYYYSGSSSDYSTQFRSLNYNWGFPRPLPATGQTPTYPNSSITFTYPVETNTTNTANYSRWNETRKTIFDPCPRGYRLPKRNDITSLTIDLDAPFISGWICSDGTQLSIPNGQSQGVYLSSYAASKSSYYRYYIDGAKTIHTGSVSSAPQGMIHPVSE